jgi:hypothetical protein
MYTRLGIGKGHRNDKKGADCDIQTSSTLKHLNKNFQIR